ncbi:PLP-dependent lyase/thiolase [Candidatus Acetothermia bacterium]|jgi:cysteine synthase|nr:PLP-dependent lyase/thiolase [Candidatus Acetothermia bacterium]MCI2425932.1 PLP-dependent lyase/thiolase [Candidatus Acetothermia bacterium]MCI2427560.1 PLP-dependent lyase/thiolase [Candidatus Acetothermia bacterium]MCI2428395.1 PLP-dependent lyase/thiolase [Candidatus Acetothermia bacterium]
MKDASYLAVMARRNEVMKRSVGIDYEEFEISPLAFDYERLMATTGYSLDDVYAIQRETQVGNTPLVELKNLTALARQLAPSGKGARIFIKDEAANPSGSFKDRRASVSVHHAKVNHYPGVVVATSGNYGAAVASQAAKHRLRCIIVQETFDSQGLGQPEIVEKGRACEAYGAEVLQLTVGPELFSVFLQVVDETGYFNASLYTPFSISGIETLGHELVMQLRVREGRDPDMVIVTHAGGGNITGTARGVRQAGCHAMIVAASVDLRGLHMASDKDFNRKAFTTGHTGFGVPFATKPDRSDVPRNAARPLRYMDRYVTVTQGEVFYITEALAQLEGMERGAAGNTSLAAAFVLAQQMDSNQIIVVQETEYTGAGKHPTAQLTLMQQMGIEIRRGDPQENIPGKVIVLPQHPRQMRVQEVDLDQLRRSYIKNAIASLEDSKILTDTCIDFLVDETRRDHRFVKETINLLKGG